MYKSITSVDHTRVYVVAPIDSDHGLAAGSPVSGEEAPLTPARTWLLATMRVNMKLPDPYLPKQTKEDVDPNTSLGLSSGTGTTSEVGWCS